MKTYILEYSLWYYLIIPVGLFFVFLLGENQDDGDR